MSGRPTVESSAVSVWPLDRALGWRAKHWLHATWVFALFVLAVGIGARRVFVPFAPLSGPSQIILGALFALHARSCRWLGLTNRPSDGLLGAGFRLLANLLLVAAVTVQGSTVWGTAIMWLLVVTAGCRDWVGLGDWIQQVLVQRWMTANWPPTEANGEHRRTTERKSLLETVQATSICEDVRAEKVVGGGEASSGDLCADAGEGLSSEEQNRVSSSIVESGGQIRQQWTRGVDLEGHEFCEGSICILLAAGQRQASGHIVVCPPFPFVPDVELEILDEIDAVVEMTQVLPQGWRMDIKVSQAAADDIWLEVGFHAQVVAD